MLAEEAVKICHCIRDPSYKKSVQNTYESIAYCQDKIIRNPDLGRTVVRCPSGLVSFVGKIINCRSIGRDLVKGNLICDCEVRLL